MSNQNTDGVLSDASQLTAEHFEPLVDSVFVVTAIQSESSDTHADPVPDENATEDASLELKLQSCNLSRQSISLSLCRERIPLAKAQFTTLNISISSNNRI